MMKLLKLNQVLLTTPSSLELIKWVNNVNYSDRKVLKFAKNMAKRCVSTHSLKWQLNKNSIQPIFMLQKLFVKHDVLELVAKIHGGCTKIW